MTVILSLFLIFRIKEIAKKMTDKIIWVYETLENVISIRKTGDDSEIQLVYKASSMEINELQLNFNKVAKTLSLATSSIDNKESEAALLNYSEAYHIFGEFDRDHSQRGVCLMNIGAIMMRKKDWNQAFACFDQAINHQKHALLQTVSLSQAAHSRQSFSRHSTELREGRFILACRLFQKAQASIALLKREFPLGRLLSRSRLEH